MNEKLAFGIAVESPVPYGVPRGAIIDVAPVVDGKPGRDRVVFADFIPNNWSAWPNTYQKIDMLDRGPDQVVGAGNSRLGQGHDRDDVRAACERGSRRDAVRR